jgi:5-methylcytosine-specific restriction enzyme B
MELPNNISKGHLLKAIEKIDAEGIPDGADSRYYDVIYKEKRYPPKLVVSYSNLFANNEILDRNSFNGGKDTEAFNLLRSNGFTIVSKESGLTDKLKMFSSYYKVEIYSKHSSDLKSFDLLVNQIPREIKTIISGLSGRLTVKGSIGQGTNTNYPWLGIFDPRVSTGATNGFYVVLLFSDDFKDLFLTLNQGSTIQTQEQTEAYRNFVYSHYSNVQNFIKGELPAGSLVKSKSGSAAKNGVKYERTNIFYRKYLIDSISEENFISNLKELVRIYIDLADKHQNNGSHLPSESDNLNSTDMKFREIEFRSALKQSSLFFNDFIITRYLCSLITKPFVVLTGLSGSGKTKLAHAFATWLCQNEEQYCIVPVGADWTNREPLLGFPNALKFDEYIKPDNRVLDILLAASKDASKPYFIILDEMNLSHVERYFADFLSVMESKGKISLYSGENTRNVPAEIQFPENLFIVGTVNIDETTYMFSPKVLDRASVIEFRIAERELDNYIQNHSHIDLGCLKGLGASMAEDFVSLAKDKSLLPNEIGEIKEVLMRFFGELKKIGAEFGYRTVSEILRFVSVVNKIEPGYNTSEIIDAAIMQKLLPKVHGSRRKLEPVLKTLGTLCLQDGKQFDYTALDAKIDYSNRNDIKYPISLEKIFRMYQNLLSNSFTSYAEA